MGRSRSANNQRSNTLNPNNPSYRAAYNNRSNQLNQNNPAYISSRSKGASVTNIEFNGIEDDPFPGGITLKEAIEDEIRVNREAVDDGYIGCAINGVEARLRERASDSLKKLIVQLKTENTSLKDFQIKSLDSLSPKELRDIIWDMIKEDFFTKGGSVDYYLEDFWVSKYLPEGLPPKRLTEPGPPLYDDDDE